MLGRIIRIVPLYWIALTLTLMIALISSTKLAYPIDEVIKSFLFIPYANRLNGESVPILSPGWTLNYEIFFYLVFALALTIVSSIRRFIILGGLFCILIAARKFIDEPGGFWFRMTSPLFLEFMAGALIAVCARNEKLTRYRAFSGCVLITASAVFMLMISQWLYLTGPRVVYFGVPAFLIVFGTVLLEPNLQKFKLNLLERIGDSSYSLYLSHSFVISLVLVPGLKGASLNGTASIGLFAAALMLVTLVGFMVYRWLETPMLRFFNSRILNKAEGVPNLMRIKVQRL